ncbi:MAG: amino acid permease, partial [Dehalococcoidia bacterium]
RVAEQLTITEAPDLPPAPAPASARVPADPMRARAVVVPVDELNKATLRALEYACSISDNVSAVHVTDELEDGEQLRRRWEELAPRTPIVVIESPYRSFIAPMLAYIDAIDRSDPEAYITVVLPEFMPAHAWEGLLHNQSANRLKKVLRHRPNTILIDVPYHLQP